MVSEDKQQILDIKVKYEDAIYGIIRYKEKIAIIMGNSVNTLS